eukprot:m.164288 g.164288  ORF g.164288 m.164288 type:complete len:707 (-) comp53102_c0_seq3:182-2302(-)
MSAASRLPELIRQYFEQFTNGCGRIHCLNAHCASNPAFPRDLTSNAKAVKAVGLARSGTDALCVQIPKALTIDDITKGITGPNQVSIDLQQRLSDVFSHPESLSSSFSSPGRSASGCRVDLTSLRQAYAHICDRQASLPILVLEAFSRLVRTFDPSRIRVVEDLHIFVIAFECPLFMDENAFDSVVEPLCRLVSTLSDTHKEVLSAWWSEFDEQHFRALVARLQQFITLRILISRAQDQNYSPNLDMGIRNALGCLQVLHAASRRQFPPLVPASDFYNDAINQGVNPRAEFLHWKGLRAMRGNAFSFCTFPFALQPSVKVALLGDENHITQQEHVMPGGMLAALLMNQGQINPYLVLTIRRPFILRDTLTHIARILFEDANQLKKPLRIEFEGEDGIDVGGVSKEFFQLVIRELFDAKYGMFLVHESTHTYSFNAHSMESPEEYKLLGIVLGLAIYNGVILDLHFPSFVYRKLLGEVVGLEDLALVDHELCQGLRLLLEYPGDDLEQVFERTFVIEQEVFGERVALPLCENGESIRLTRENREEYVRLYVDHVLNASITRQFAAFKEGFDTVCAGSDALKLFSPTELELAICGTSSFDFDALRRVAKYDGFASTDAVIVWFWEVAIAFTDEEKKKLLFFTTGTDRVPVGGIDQMKFIIVKQGADSDRLPTAHTCFNVLLLPHYSSKAKLESLLRKAILHAEGFGMR